LFAWQLAVGLLRSCCTFCHEFAASLPWDVFWVYREFTAAYLQICRNLST
jgi:hypothetical protein